MIEFHEPRDVLLRNVQTRMEKHGDQDKPAIDLSISVTGPNTLLDMIHPELLLSLFKPLTETPGELPLPTEDYPSLRFPRLDVPIKFDIEHAGLSLKIAYGATGKADMAMGAVRLSKLRIGALIEGGSVELLFTLSTLDVSEKVIGKLSLMQGHDVSLTLTAPEVAQSTVDQQAAARKEAEALFQEPAQTPEQALLATEK